MRCGAAETADRMRARPAALAMVGALVFAAASPRLAPAEDFYAGKTLTIIVGFSPGGGFDVNTRLLARHIGGHIPGRPDVVVVNMPGAGSAFSVHYLDTSAPKDGTVIDDFNFGLIGDALLQPKKVPIDFRNYAWIGSISEDLTVCYLWRALGPANLAEMRKRGNFHFGVTGFGTSEDLNTKILKSIFGIDIHQVAGYPGSAEIRLAIERGELDGDCGAWSSIPEDWIQQHKINPITRSGRTRPADMPPDIPVVADIAPDDHARRVIRLLLADGEVGRPFIASRAVPRERIAILRQAFDATVRDPAFIAEARKLRLPVSPKSGAEAAKVVDEIYANPPDIVAAARAVLGE